MSEASEQAYSHQELKQGQLPHQMMLFNLVGNHILLTVITLSNSSMPWLALLIPSLSLIIISALMFKGRTAIESESLFVKCHWRLAMQRNRIFLFGYGALMIAGALAWTMYTQMHVMKELSYAIVGGLGILPVMVLVLILTVMESETLNHALHGRIPEGIKNKVLGQVAAVPR